MIRSVYNHHSSNDSSNKGCILYMLVGFSYCMIYIFHTLLPAYLKYSCILITILPMLSVNYLRGNYSIILHLLISSLSWGEPVSYILPCDPFSDAVFSHHLKQSRSTYKTLKTITYSLIFHGCLLGRIVACSIYRSRNNEF